MRCQLAQASSLDQLPWGIVLWGSIGALPYDIDVAMSCFLIGVTEGPGGPRAFSWILRQAPKIGAALPHDWGNGTP